MIISRNGPAPAGARFRARAVWVRTKEALGLPTKSDANFYIDRFSRALRSGATGKNLLVMAIGKNDGAGSQAQANMSALCFARAHGLAYVHRPFATIEHAEGDMDSWVRACETYFNLGAGEMTLDRVSAPVIPVDRLPLVPHHTSAIVTAEHYLRFCNNDPGAWERVLPDLRAKFWGNKKRSPRRPGEIRIAVHMRRGDVSASNSKVARNFTPNGVFVNTLSRLKALLDARACRARIGVYSQGMPEDFADLTALGAELHLDTPALETHRALVDADVLIMSKGAFSYTAGILNEGITLYDPQKYRRLEPWVARNADGSFDEGLVARRIEALLDAGMK